MNVLLDDSFHCSSFYLKRNAVISASVLFFNEHLLTYMELLIELLLGVCSEGFVFSVEIHFIFLVLGLSNAWF